MTGGTGNEDLSPNEVIARIRELKRKENLEVEKLGKELEKTDTKKLSLGDIVDYMSRISSVNMIRSISYGCIEKFFKKEYEELKRELNIREEKYKKE